MDKKYAAIKWAWHVPDDTPLPSDMVQKLAAEGVEVKSRTSGELIDELDAVGLIMGGSLSKTPSIYGPFFDE